MRKLNQIMLLVMAVSLVTFTSCSSDDDNNGGGSPTGDEFLTATIDGAGFAAAQSPSVIVGAQSTNGVLAVQGGDNNGNTMTITLPNYTGVGTYVTGDNISNQNGIMYLELNGMSPVSWASNFATATLGTLMAGSVEVTSDDGTTVQGTFSFEGYNASDMTTKVITNGEFKALFD